jgi:hypothetical protein
MVRRRCNEDDIVDRTSTKKERAGMSVRIITLKSSGLFCVAIT